MTRDLIPCTSRRFYSLTKCLDCLCSPHFLFNGYQRLFPPGGKLTTCLHLLLGLGMHGAILPLPMHLMACEVTLPLPYLSTFDTHFQLKRETLQSPICSVLDYYILIRKWGLTAQITAPPFHQQHYKPMMTGSMKFKISHLSMEQDYVPSDRCIQSDFIFS